MSTNTIPERQDGTTIFASWANDIRTAIYGDFVPRNTSAVATDQAGSLGSTTFKWLSAYLHNLYLYNSTLRTRILRASGGANYDFTLPNNVPGNSKSAPLIFNTDGTVSYLSAAPNRVLSSSSGLAPTTSDTFADIPNMSCTITTLGNPVHISLIPDGSSTGNVVQGLYAQRSSTGQIYRIILMRDGVQICEFGLHITSSGATFVRNAVPPAVISYEDPVAAGTYVYKLQHKIESTSNSGEGGLNYSKLLVKEVTS